jgi:hypothetical protein
LKRRAAVVAVITVPLVIAATLLMTRTAPPDEPNTFSRRAGGLMLARRYLEARGIRCTELTGAIGSMPSDEAYVMAFPAITRRQPQEIGTLKGWVRHGGTLVILYASTRPGLDQMEVLEAFSVATTPVPGLHDLNPFRWWRKARTPWRLRSPSGQAPVLISRPRLALVAEPHDTILLRTIDRASARTSRGAAPKRSEEDGLVMGLARGSGRGALVVLPTEALTNGRLLTGGNPDLLEWLRHRLPATVTFDELLHGFGAPPLGATAGTPVADYLLAHLAVIYLLVVLALGRRQGPPWPVETTRGHSVGGLLLRFGAVHRRMGHQAEGAQALVRRAAAFGGWTTIPEGLMEAAKEVHGRRLVQLAQHVARLQQTHR